MKIRGHDGRFQRTGTSANLTDGSANLAAHRRTADSQATGFQRAPSTDRPHTTTTLDHGFAAARLLHGTEDGALPPSLRIEAAKTHALLALVDGLDQVLAVLRDGTARRG